MLAHVTHPLRSSGLRCALPRRARKVRGRTSKKLATRRCARSAGPSAAPRPIGSAGSSAPPPKPYEADPNDTLAYREHRTEEAKALFQPTDAAARHKDGGTGGLDGNGEGGESGGDGGARGGGGEGEPGSWRG